MRLSSCVRLSDRQTLSRKFLQTWDITWDINLKLARKERCMTLYHQTSPRQTLVQLHDRLPSETDSASTSGSSSINSLICWAENIPGVEVSVARDTARNDR